MAKISFLLFAMALIAFLHAYEARHLAKFDEAAFVKDLHKAEAMIEKEVKAKRIDIQGLTSEVKTLSKSKAVLSELGTAFKKDMNLKPYEKKLKKISRVTTVKKAPAAVAKKKKPVSIIQSILKDFGLNGGKN